ncbi:phosphotransferase family protein [Kribbella shirazensis]|uniref:Aminoglycoside phosphotransferase (APT) family kinase protein n=1 Tax=Kribbella shirazensis TaxID=1105143 RepID=A0A7X6A1P4_9ACTN|nr:aminoglycoside phosphotransferase family protein [Kribbella shirazensis]NIK57409.1 aminoglycoside phosphotransferase (APT) family kinase protein [Kribbella shirazensis]
MRWLDDCSPAAIAQALRAVAPELSNQEIVVRASIGDDDPEWQAASAMVGERFVVKFAWSRPAALRLAHEVGILVALAAEPGVPFLPEIVASSTDPLLLVTRRIPGTALFDVVDSIDREDAGRQLAGFLAALHHPATVERVGRLTGGLPLALLPPATTRTIRQRFGQWVRPDQVDLVLRWCDWADAVLASSTPTVLVHGDLHGGNQVWEGDRLRVVVDFETAGTAEPEYDLRAFPGTGPGVELLDATLRHYQHLAGRRLSPDRVMAWHLRTALGDALWRSEADVPLPDHRTPIAWVDDLAARFSALDIEPTQLP